MGISATPGQASCSDVVYKHKKDSTGFCMSFHLVTVWCPPPPQRLVVLFFCFGLRYFYRYVGLLRVFVSFFFLNNNLKLCREREDMNGLGEEKYDQNIFKLKNCYILKSACGN